MEQNNITQIIKQLKLNNMALGVENQLTQSVVHPHAKKTNIKFLVTSEDGVSGAEFICDVEDALQIQEALIKLIDKTSYRFYEL